MLELQHTILGLLGLKGKSGILDQELRPVRLGWVALQFDFFDFCFAFRLSSFVYRI